MIKTSNTQNPSLALKVARTSILLAVFLVPCFFFSFSTNVYEFPKAAVFYLLTIIASLACLARVFFSKKAEIKFHFASFVAVAFFLIIFAATLFSENRWASFLGVDHFSGTLVTVFFLLVMFLTITSFAPDEKTVWWLVACFLLAGTVASIFFLLAVAGIQFTPALNMVAESFSIFGTFLAVTFVAGFGLMVLAARRQWRIIFLINNLIIFAALFVLDEMISWILLVIGLFFWLVFLSFQSKKFSSFWVVLPTLLIILFLFLSFFSTSQITGASFVRDSTLSFATSLAVVKNTLADSFLLGSGPELFSEALALGRPISFNDSQVWFLRFGKSGNELWQIMSTAGFFALACFIIMGLSLLIAGFRQLFKIKEKDPRWSVAPLVLFPLAVLFIASLFTSFSIVLAFSFWLFFALVVLLFPSRKYSLDLVKSAGHNFVFSLCFALFLVAAVSFSFLIGRLAVGEYLAYRADLAISQTDDLEQVKDYLSGALRLNSWRSDWHLALAENYAVQAQITAQAEKPDSYLINSQVQDSLAEVRAAQTADSKNPLVYDQSLVILTSLNNLLPDLAANDLLASYSQARKIDPHNPAYAYAYGELLLNSAETLAGSKEELTQEQQENKNILLTQASEQLSQATSLKSYYLPAEIKLSRAQELAGKIDQAIARIDQLLLDLPANHDLLFESGRLYLAAKNTESAKQRFNQILLNNPDSIDARYMLALTLEQEGNLDQAILELETIQNTTLGSQVVADKLAELKSKVQEGEIKE